MDNNILQTPEKFLNSQNLKDKRKSMVDEFQNIMFTSLEKRKKLSDEQNAKKGTKLPKVEA
jgi:hypothetical protein